MLNHRPYVCQKDHDDGRGCRFCDGGLVWCTQCDGFEGQLTTECWGHKLPAWVLDAVWNGTKDYRGGEWVDADRREVAV